MTSRAGTARRTHIRGGQCPPYTVIVVAVVAGLLVSAGQEAGPPAQRQQGSYPAPRRGPSQLDNRAKSKAPRPADQQDDLDARIGQAMRKAVDFLLSRFQGPELVATPGKGQTYREGLHALCVYALLTASLSVPHERLNIRGDLLPKLIDAMKSHAMASDEQVLNLPVTYGRSLRAAALAVYNRPEDRAALKADVAWLVAAEYKGSYTYDDRYTLPHDPPYDPNQIPWDNSNSQYGLLGTWGGAEVAIEVPQRYWRDVEQHWKQSQLSDGRWPYSPYQPNVSLAMTCGGIASLMVTHDYLDAPAWRTVGRDPFPGPLGLGLKWLETADHSVQLPNDKTFYLGYDLYGLERVGLACGFKFFGSHDWYRELGEKVLQMQLQNGAFTRQQMDADTITDAAYVLLFLARGRFPVFMDKLRFDPGAPGWANRPRDLANLARFASHEMERPFNWQVVSVEREWYDWLDSPVLYIASHEPPAFTAAEYAKLRSFVLAGGLIFTHADTSSEAFNKWVPELVRKVCPEYEMQTLGANHLLYSIDYHIGAPRPKLLGVSNGSRLLIVHSPTDLAAAWQMRDSKRYADRFRVAVNIFIYAAGKKEFRNRVKTPYVPPPTVPPARSVTVARLKYSGNWDPEPYAWTRFGHILERDRGEGIELHSVDLRDLRPGVAPLAHLTGTAAYMFTDAQLASLRQYVSSGGVLLIDACGGENAFAESVCTELLPRAFTGARPELIPPRHPLYRGLAGEETGASPLRLRPCAIERMGRVPSPLRLIHFGQGHVVLSSLDLTSGLLGTDTWGIMGYASKDAQQFITNLIVWANQAANTNEPAR